MEATCQFPFTVEQTVSEGIRARPISHGETPEDGKGSSSELISVVIHILKGWWKKDIWRGEGDFTVIALEAGMPQEPPSADGNNSVTYLLDFHLHQLNNYLATTLVFRRFLLLPVFGQPS